MQIIPTHQSAKYKSLKNVYSLTDTLLIIIVIMIISTTIFLLTIKIIRLMIIILVAIKKVKIHFNDNYAKEWLGRVIFQAA